MANKNLLVYFLLSFLFSNSIFPNSGEEKTKNIAANNIQQKINPILKKYCDNLCDLVRVNVSVEESLSQIDDLGFEGASVEGERNFEVNSVQIEIQADDRIGKTNRS